MENVPITTNCVLHRGETYQGDANTDKNGNPCVAGEYCRNPTPDKNLRPYCNSTESFENVDCQIKMCHDRFGPFVGSRGVIADTGATGYNDKWHQQPDYRYDHKTRHIRDNTFFMPSDHVSYTGSHNADNFIGRQRFYFIPPRTGKYRLMVNTDDYGGAYIHYPKTGQFEKLLYITAWQPVFDFNARVHQQHTRTFHLTQGEEVAFEAFNQEHGGGDHLIVGVQYVADNDEVRFDVNTQDPARVNYMMEWQRHGFQVKYHDENFDCCCPNQPSSFLISKASGVQKFSIIWLSA